MTIDVLTLSLMKYDQQEYMGIEKYGARLEMGDGGYCTM